MYLLINIQTYTYMISTVWIKVWASKNITVTPPKVGENQIVGKGGTTEQNDFCTVYLFNKQFQSFICTLQKFTQSETFWSWAPFLLLIASKNGFCTYFLLSQCPTHLVRVPVRSAWAGVLCGRKQLRLHGESRLLTGGQNDCLRCVSSLGAYMVWKFVTKVLYTTS